MFRNASSRVTPRHKLRGFLPVLDAPQHRLLNTENSATSRRSPPPITLRALDVGSRSKPADVRPRNAERNRNGAKLRYVGQQSGEVHLLRPAVLSERLQKLCRQDKPDDAVTMLKNAPLDAQNTVVWNTIIHEAMKLKRFKLAYQLYVDMKRRGFTPTSRTFSTLLAGYRKIDDWRIYSKQLDNVHTVMQNFKDWLESVDVNEMDTRNEESLTIPYSLYIGILGDARLYQKMFDVYYSMPQDGPCAPNQYTYSALLHAVRERISIEGLLPEAVAAQNASDAKLVWKQIVRASEKRGFPIDQHIIVAVLRGLSRGRPSDVLFAYEIIHDYCGLSKPGEDPVPAKVSLNSYVVSTILETCNFNQKYRLAIHYVQQIVDRPLKRGEILPLDREVMEQVLKSYAYLASMGSMSEADQALETLQWMLRQEILDPRFGSKLRPRLETYALVLVACWRGADWVTATRTFELLTGCNGKDFRDGQSHTPRIAKRSSGRILEPDSAVLSTMLRTAYATQDRANMRQSLRMAAHYHAIEMLDSVSSIIQATGSPSVPAPDGQEPPTMSGRIKEARGKRAQQFYGSKLAEALVDVVDKVLSRSDSKAADAKEADPADETQGYVVTEEERKRWLALRSKAKEVDRLVRSLKAPLVGPRYEEEPLGSLRGLRWTDQKVDWDMTQRSMKSSS